jgi:hypothetical protein
MPLFMGIHRGDGPVTADEVVRAHEADLAKQGEYVHYHRYWVDEDGGRIFCLVNAPDADTAARVHREAHGLVAHEVYEVSEHSVEDVVRARQLAEVFGTRAGHRPLEAMCAAGPSAGLDRGEWRARLRN